MDSAAFYARVNTDHQADKGLIIPARLKGLREYAHRHDKTVVAEYIDDGYSARTADKPEFQKQKLTNWLAQMKRKDADEQST